MDTHIQGPVSSTGNVGNSVGAILSQRGFPVALTNNAVPEYLCTIEASIDNPILTEIDGYIETGFNGGGVNNISVGTETSLAAYVAAGVIAPATLGWQAGKKVLLRVRTPLFAMLQTGTQATGTITSTNTAPADGATVTIGSKTYTFKTTLTPTEGEVLINTTADAALLNLIRAINHSGAPGTDYSVASANSQVSAATSVTSHAFAVTALYAGAAGNSIATPTPSTTPVSDMSWGATTLTGGVDSTTGKMELIVKASGFGKGSPIAT